MYLLSNGDYICKSGKAINKCAAPDILQPVTADLHDQMSQSFHHVMGHGITSSAEQKINARRAYEDQYQRNLQSELFFRNEENIAEGKPLEPLPSKDYEDKIKGIMAEHINPVFASLGHWFQWLLGLLIIASMVTGAIGAVYRMTIDFRYHGYVCMYMM